MSVVTIKSLAVPEHEGWMTKQGGSVKSWKRRWFILKGNTLYYFKASRPETEMQGSIELTPTSFVKPQPKHGKQQAFAVGSQNQKRIFFMYADQDSESVSWMKSINAAIDRLKGVQNGSSSSGSASSGMGMGAGTGAGGSASTSGGAGGNGEPTMSTGVGISANSAYQSTGAGAGAAGSSSIRAQLTAGRNEVYFLKEDDNKVLEFWQIWFDSIAPREEITSPGHIEYEVATSADMQKLTWRTAGPQNIFIQRMVDFFWNVGAPESEIDRLNDVGAAINPQVIGSWIDMSSKRGMDGGWYFPADIPIKFALDATDPGEPSAKLAAWAERNKVVQCYSVGRDMGAAPPRQTEIRLRLPGDSFDSQLALALDAFQDFGFPALPEEALSIVRQHPKAGLRLSVVTSSEGFVRLGVLIPDPDRTALDRLSPLSGASSSDPLIRFSNSLGLAGPHFVEFQFLMKGFGYGVYKEGFDVIFHYLVGREEK
jgi:hypothetical protein